MSDADPRDIFIVAEQFRSAGILTALVPKQAASGDPHFDWAKDTPNMESAAMACLAFALELYLKCFIRIEGKSYAKEHKLTKLFKLLSAETRGELEKQFEANAANVRSYVARTYAASGRPAPTVTLDFILTASNDAFVNFRYIHECGTDADKGWLGDTVVTGIRRMILAMHPDWEAARQLSPTTEIFLPPTFRVR